MPRRQYTYGPGLGWTGWNLLETIGSYVLGLGLLLVAVNLAVSRFRGPAVGRDPFNGATLEWAAESPPAPYNFAVIPKVTSPYPMWDEQDRIEDARKLDRGELVLDHGHETPGTTPVDAEYDETLEMPSDSPWPILLAAALALVFVFLLTGHWTTALVFAGAAAAVLVAWHSGEPQEA
jgi:cytochrome c oxidase subunit 1/cytochrome c oxidase subunit I+III